VWTLGRSPRRLVDTIAAPAEFEPDLIREQTSAGLAAAQARSRTGGQPA
jgi:DNA invertase Pin-like site-specific DNA recombinase